MRCAATRAARAPNYRCACASGDLRRRGSCSTLGVQDLCRSTARFSDVEPLLPGPGADAAGVFGVFAREGVRVGDTADRVAVRMDCESERCGCTGLVEGGEDVVEDDAGSSPGSAWVRAVGTQLSILVALCDTVRQRRPGWLSGARP